MPARIFFCYAHEDEELLNKLERYLWPLRRQGLIDVWHDRDISAGMEWEHEISKHLNEAQIILLLISPDFMYSEYCYGIEMKRALERHERGEARVIPVILRPIHWQGEPLGKLQALPKNARAVSLWPNRDEAFSDIAEGIKDIAEGIQKEVKKLITKPGRTDIPLPREAPPPPTNPKTIQQREKIVRDVYAKLTQPDVTAIALTGMSGVGKSTLTALVRNYAENQRLAGSGLFAAEPLWLTIDPAVTFAGLAETLFKAMGKPMPDFGLWAPQNQAVVLFNALNMTDKPRLIILDQFENLLDRRTGRALSDRPGVGEWLDAINSQNCICRILLTSHLRPQGTGEFPPSCMQEFSVRGLEVAEGVELLRKQGGDQGVKAMEAELRVVVERCEGHALALTLLASLLRYRSLSLNIFLQDPEVISLLIGDKLRNLLNHIYTRQLDQLDRRLLLAFSVYREAVPLEAAQAVINYSTEAPKTQVHTALDTLLKQHLLEASDKECYQLHPIVARYVQDYFVEDDKLANQQALRAAHVRAAQYYREQATISCPPREQRRQSSDMRPLIEAVWQFCQAELWKEAYNLIVQEHLFADLIRCGEAAILLELCQLLLPLDKWHPEPSQEALIYNHLGAVYGMLEQREQGWDYCVKALNISRKIKYREGEGMGFDTLGTLCDVAGQWNQALKYYEQAMAIREKIGDRDQISVTLNNLGGVYNSLGRPDRALTYYEQALGIRREVGDRRGEGTTLNNIGLVYDKLGQKERALKYYEQALGIRREVGDRRGEGTTLNYICHVYGKLGQKDKALAYYKQGLKIFREIEDRAGEAVTLHNIGTFYFEQGRYDVALACFQLNIFGGVQSPNYYQGWLEVIESKVGKKRFDRLYAKVQPQASQIVERALSTSLVNPLRKFFLDPVLRGNPQWHSESLRKGQPPEYAK